MERYMESLKELKLYLRIVKKIPSEAEWDRYALIQGILSSRSIEYGYGKKFNKMCREMIKKS